MGADGIKILGVDRDIMAALLDEAHKLGLRVAHHVGVEETNAWDDIKFGTTSIEHWYGIPDAAIESGRQDFPSSYNYANEVDRFRYAGRLWREASPERLTKVLEGMVAANVAWDPTLASRAIAEEWVKMTFSDDPKFVGPVVDMMMASREAVVDYMTPLGLAHLMATGHHYGPGPWVSDLKRPEWNPVYYHHADAAGIGFDRTPSGSNATSQYAPAVAAQFNDINRIPEKFLLWFHHVPWTRKMASGHTLWDELVVRYDEGVAATARAQAAWAKMKPFVDAERFDEETAYLAIENKEAQWWRDACLAYFETFSKMPFPAGHAAPPHDVAYYKAINFPFVPGH